MNGKLLTKKADELYQKANKLLLDYPFQDTAEKYFDHVEVVGAAATNLMLDPDIDFDCLTSQLDKQVLLKFVGGLLSIKECKKVILYNHLSDAEVPHLIVNVENFDFAGEKWILTFFVAEGEGRSASRKIEWIRSNLTERKREVILKFKNFRTKKGLKRSIPSDVIYEAVISENIFTEDAFRSYLLKQGIDVS